MQFVVFHAFFVGVGVPDYAQRAGEERFRDDARESCVELAFDEGEAGADVGGALFVGVGVEEGGGGADVHFVRWLSVGLAVVGLVVELWIGVG